MSKAFTKEDAGGDEVLGREPPRVSRGEKRYVTPEGHQALREELERLLAERSDLTRQPSVEASARLKELEHRITILAATLESVTPVEADGTLDGRVFFGAWVTLEDEDGGRMTYRIVGPDEADAKAGRVSVESPLARALLGREEGDSVVVERPRGPSEYTVLEVRYHT
jgi:transcription elongation factor GreB